MTRRLHLLAAAILLLGAPAFGDVLTLTFGSLLEAGPPGGSVTFQGTITDSDGYPYCCLNSIETSFGSPGNAYLFVDLGGVGYGVFFTDVAGTLFGDYTDSPIFDILIAPDTPAGLYSGTATLLGGSDELALDPLVSQNFQVEVTPEPGMLGLTLSGLATLAAIARRRIR